jgi:glycosyltransferase involved in cell wall biosynthesis
MLRVAFDISSVAAASVLSMPKAGIHRVVDQLGRSLALNASCDLQYVSYGDLYERIAARKHLRNGSHAQGSSAAPQPARATGILGSLSRRYYQLPNALKHAVRRQCLIADSVITHLLDWAPAISASALAKSDVYHAPGNSIPRVTRRFKHLKRFITIHDIIPLRHPEYCNPIQIDGMRKTIEGIHGDDWIFATTQHVKDDLCDYARVDPSRIFVVPLAADKTLFYPCVQKPGAAEVTNRYGITDQPYLLSVATLEPRKNIARLVRCFLQFIQQQKIPDLNLVLVGGKGWMYDAIFRESMANGTLRNRIIFTGYVRDDELAAIYSAAMGFAYLSFVEGFGLPVLEAMQCGTPVIASNTSSLPEVIGDAGLLVAPNDEDAICQAMYRMHTHADLRRELSEKGIGRAAKFTWDRSAAETIAAYHQALTQS